MKLSKPHRIAIFLAFTPSKYACSYAYYEVLSEPDTQCCHSIRPSYSRGTPWRCVRRSRGRGRRGGYGGIRWDGIRWHWQEEDGSMGGGGHVTLSAAPPPFRPGIDIFPSFFQPTLRKQLPHPNPLSHPSVPSRRFPASTSRTSSPSARSSSGRGGGATTSFSAAHLRRIRPKSPPPPPPRPPGLAAPATKGGGPTR